MHRSIGPLVALALVCTSAAAAQTPTSPATPGSQPAPPPSAQSAQPPSPQTSSSQPPLPIVQSTVDVIGTTPLSGTGVDRDKVPANVQSLTASDLSNEGSPSLLTGLTDQAGGVNVNATLDDPFQPDVLYRGFEASPVLGTPQGLAVYQNGVRVNEAFGDTVNWDLIPDLAIDRVDVVSTNPVYGLNALGGAVVVDMKNGFTHQGFTGEFSGGSFGQRNGSIEYGKASKSGHLAAYVAGRAFNEDGWRQFSPDGVRQLYADLSGRWNRATLDVTFTGATNSLSGEGTAPVQELTVDRTLIFTSPQNNANTVGFVTVNGSYQATPAFSIQGNVYTRDFHQDVANGNTTDYTACDSDNGLLCQSDAETPLVTASGASIPDLSHGGDVPIGENDRETIHAIGTGGTLQATNTHAIGGHENHLVVGGSVDHMTIDFQSSAEVGVIDDDLAVLPSGFFVDTPEDSGFNTTPLGVHGANDYYGLFATDTFNVTPAVAITVSGRYNGARISLADQIGSNLSGNSQYNRFNPAIGGTDRLGKALTAYAGYSEGNRVPTPSEIECADPTAPCLLPSSLSSDPPTLKQVVSHTIEAGVRGTIDAPAGRTGALHWDVGFFRTNLTDDIYGVATSISSGFFENIGATRREGVEASVTYRAKKISFYATYDLVDATFQSALMLPSSSNPFADDDGNISVAPGDRLPGIPAQQIKIGADYHVTPKWTIGGVVIGYGDQYLRGDESNQNPTLPGYAVVNLHTTYTVTHHLDAFVTLQNAFDARYSTFGQFGDPTGIGAPGIPDDADTNGPGVDNRFLSPAPPIAVFGGVHVRM